MSEHNESFNAMVEDHLDRFISHVSENEPLPKYLNRKSRQWGLTVLLTALRVYSKINRAQGLDFQKALADSFEISQTLARMNPEEVARIIEGLKG